MGYGSIDHGAVPTATFLAHSYTLFWFPGRNTIDYQTIILVGSYFKALYRNYR